MQQLKCIQTYQFLLQLQKTALISSIIVHNHIHGKTETRNVKRHAVNIFLVLLKSTTNAYTSMFYRLF